MSHTTSRPYLPYEQGRARALEQYQVSALKSYVRNEVPKVRSVDQGVSQSSVSIMYGEHVQGLKPYHS